MSLVKCGTETLVHLYVVLVYDIKNIIYTYIYIEIWFQHHSKSADEK